MTRPELMLKVVGKTFEATNVLLKRYNETHGGGLSHGHARRLLECLARYERIEAERTTRLGVVHVRYRRYPTRMEKAKASGTVPTQHGPKTHSAASAGAAKITGGVAPKPGPAKPGTKSGC